MKKIYNITKLQLIVIWVFGIILAFVFQDCGYNTGCGSTENAITTLVLFLVVFYTAGWWQNKKFSYLQKFLSKEVTTNDPSETHDDLYEEAREAVVTKGNASISYLQRKLGIGYSRAEQLMDMLEKRGVIGPEEGSRTREVIK
jgi:DNA segregation ATPase FtsK/SpoIIIE-like protein